MTLGREMPDMSMKPEDLYREEVFTDRKVGTVRRLTPVNGAGETDPSRPVLFVGETQILTPMGTLPLSFEISAATLEEAAKGYEDAAKKAVEKAVEELNELRREAASSIVVPQGGVGGPAGGFPPPPGGGGGIIRP